jgi:suppressor of tumorigenicity protein 13
MEQWKVSVKIETLDRGDVVVVKNRWLAGETVSVQIEPHATINMLKQRVALLVACHTKHQTMTSEAGEELDDLKKLEDCITDGGVVLLHVRQPKEAEAPPVVLSDDEDLREDADPTVLSLPAAGGELSDEQQDAQNALKQEAAELLEDGDTAGALAKFSDALAIGAPTAMMIAKRAEILLKLKRFSAASADATAALEINPDSAKAYKTRGKARRFLGDYEGAVSDLNKSQAMDYDDGVADMHDYVQKRLAKMKLKAQQDAKAAAE